MKVNKNNLVLRDQGESRILNVGSKPLKDTRTTSGSVSLQIRGISAVLLTLALVVLNTTVLQAQPNNPGSPVPIDGGLGLLAAGGAALAYRKYRRRQE